MQEAKISEIFLSYQGEGPYAGSRQLFLRFYDCNLNCQFCDTLQVSYKTFTKQTLLSKILDAGDDYNELVLTGGEPLMHADFLAEFLPYFRKHKSHPVYLETNGTLPDTFEKVRRWVDIVAMDIKIPSSTLLPDEDIWDLHAQFLRCAKDKHLLTKAVITGTTKMSDIKKMSELLSDPDLTGPVVLQPVTPEDRFVEASDLEMLTYFKGYLQQRLKNDIIVLGQMHGLLNIK